VSRSSKAIKGKRKAETKKARVKRRAVPERMRSERGVKEVTHGAGYYARNGSRDNAGSQAGAAVALATNAAPKMNDPGRSDPPQRPDAMARATAIYPQATAALSALQAWFLLPLRNLQSWQEAWFRLLPR
jgi:hypothetical protein